MTSSTATELSWLPSDAEEQLALGFRIVSNAYKTRVTAQEGEIRSLKAQNAERAELNQQLQKKNSALEVQLIESTQRANQLSDENKQLVNTVKKLHRDINRLECLKKAVLNSIQEDHHSAESEDSHKFYGADDILQTTAPRTMQEMGGIDDISNTLFNKISANESLFFSSPTSSVAGLNSDEVKNHSSATIDGKAFFRNARGRMSYENFNIFLANIKRLNNHQQTRDETLKNAHELFGEENRDLYEDFKVLLHRHA